MAKAKKQPKDDGGGGAKSESTEAVVLHQKLCLSIDMENRRIYGCTELKVAVPDSGIVGLHAENLEIERVCVDGEPAEFDVFPHFLPVEIENRWCSVSSVASAADAAAATYISALERELVPNLLVFCPSKPHGPDRAHQYQMNNENGEQEPQSNGDNVEQQSKLNTENVELQSHLDVENSELQSQPITENAELQSQPNTEDAALQSQPDEKNAEMQCQPDSKNAELQSRPDMENAELQSQSNTGNAELQSQPTMENAELHSQLNTENAELPSKPELENAELLSQSKTELAEKQSQLDTEYTEPRFQPTTEIAEQGSQPNIENAEQQSQASTENVEQQSQPNTKDGGQFAEKNERLVRIDYWVDKLDTGVHFDGAVLHTDNQLRRAHCWFPCMDDSAHSCCYHLEFTVPQDFVAVSNGDLLCQVLSRDDPPRKTFIYELKIPVSAKWISLVVAPFQILVDCHNSQLTHMCLPDNLTKLQNTVGFSHSAFRHFENYLKAPFPFGSYKQVFIAPQMTISTLTMGASMAVFSSQLLFDEKIIDQLWEVAASHSFGSPVNISRVWGLNDHNLLVFRARNIDVRIKFAHALARQWFGIYITPETATDEWLVEGLAGFLTDTFIKEFLGNNEARYRRHKANCAVCKVDECGATALSSAASTKDLYGTQSIGFLGKIRAWKSVAILQMLEKQMGPDLFKGILRTIVSRAQSTSESSRTLNTKEFRQFANKIGNLERPFLKEFFHRWVRVCGCPILRMGFSYHKRKNTVELAAFRECTAAPGSTGPLANGNVDSENRDGDGGWPGMMTVKVHELDGTHDHLLPMAGDAWQLLDIRCHSKLASKRYQKSKKGPRPDGSDDNGDTVAASEMRYSTESPLLWLRADPEMEYLAEIHFHQPVQMWINQLEKDKDVVAQSQAIISLEALPHSEFSVINVLSNFLSDSKVFWRVRVEAAYALAKLASEENDWCGLLHLVKFYKSKRYDAATGLPKPNDFHNLSEYFVLEAIPLAVATVRATEGGSPREAIEFVLQVLKYNDNNGNPFSDTFWLASLVEAVGELEFEQEAVPYLSSLLKRIDRLLQFERLMPSYNGILTISCIRTLTQIALKLSEFIPLEGVLENIKLFKDPNVIWQVRIEASRALLDLELHNKGINATLLSFIKFLEEEPSLRGQVKLAVHMCRLCQIRAGTGHEDQVKSQTLVALLRLLESRVAFCNIALRHHIFCTLQVLAGRRPTLYGVPRDQTRQISFAQICSEQRNNFAALLNQVKPLEDIMIEDQIHPYVESMAAAEEVKEPEDISNPQNIPNPQELNMPDSTSDPVKNDSLVASEPTKAADTVSNSQERKTPIVKIRVKRPSASNKTVEADNLTVEKSQGGHHGNDLAASSSVSVDAPQGNRVEPLTTSGNQNLEEVNSSQGRGSHVTASIGSAKFVREGDEVQCTADSRNIIQTHTGIGEETTSGIQEDKKKEKKRKRDDHRSHRDDPEYSEKKRLKKERKHKEKEMAKLMKEKEASTSLHPPSEGKVEAARTSMVSDKPVADVAKAAAPEGGAGVPKTGSHKLRIKIKRKPAPP